MKKNEIFSTRNYDLFKKLPGNRPLNPANLSRIEVAVRAGNVPTPAIVNKQMQVIDGQHKIEISKRLGLVVEYIMREDWGLDEAQRLNQVGKKWDDKDWSLSYIAQGNENYQQFLDFKDKYKLPSDISAQLLGGLATNRDAMSAFTEGKFKVKNYALACKYAEQILEIGQYFTGYRKTYFMRAMIMIFRLEVYVHNNFIHKLKTFPTLMVQSPTVEGFVLTIEKVYNYQNRTKVYFHYPLYQK